MRRRLAAAALLAAGLLAGCAGLGVRPPGVDLLSGRLSVRVEGQPERAFNAAFELQGDAEAGALALTTPIGTQVARAEWSRQQVQLHTREGSRSYADLESLSVDAIGERLPLAALFDWLRGRPWPGAPSQSASQGFEQLGWHVDLARQGEGLVVAERAAAPVVTVRAKLDASPLAR